MQNIAVAAVIATGVFAFTGLVNASILGFSLALIVLVNAALTCALLLPVAIRALGEYNRPPGEGDHALESRPKARAVPLEGGGPAGDGGSPVEELSREEDAHNSVERGDRQETTGNGHRWEEDIQEEGHSGADRESQSARPRPGRAHLEGFRRLGLKLRQEAKPANCERNGPETDGDS